ncbi:Flp family type IVb pilin [Methylacidiphilales bacterium]|nr:Flp family type IVb pilin [Candidatus Methylacidiphilales bacterium]MDB4793539.1 Flp family type IVb pilin [Candidatus Methylacidiphilales bacterium]
MTYSNRKRFLSGNCKSKRGQTLVEYALILAFISVVAISVLISLGKQVNATYSKINSVLASAQASH